MPRFLYTPRAPAGLFSRNMNCGLCVKQQLCFLMQNCFRSTPKLQYPYKFWNSHRWIYEIIIIHFVAIPLPHIQFPIWSFLSLLKLEILLCNEPGLHTAFWGSQQGFFVLKHLEVSIWGQWDPRNISPKRWMKWVSYFSFVQYKEKTFIGFHCLLFH